MVAFADCVVIQSVHGVQQRVPIRMLREQQVSAHGAKRVSVDQLVNDPCDGPSAKEHPSAARRDQN